MARQCALWVVLVGLMSGVGLGQEPSGGLKDQVADLLETGWQRTFAARGDAQVKYDRLAAKAPNDYRVRYAYTLVLLRQLRYPEAGKSLDGVLESNTKSLNLWKTRAWLAVLTKDYDSALIQMQRLAELLPPKDLPGDAELPNRSTAELLGQLWGFLTGPAKDAVDGRWQEQFQQRVVARLTPTRQVAFEKGRQAVLKEFNESVEEAERTSAAAKVAGEQQKERVLEDLDKKKDELSAEVTAEKARQEEVKKQLTYELDKIAGQERELNASARQVEFEAVSLRREIRVLQDRVAYLRASADSEKDNDRKQRLLDEAAHWQLMAQRPITGLQQLEAQAARLVAQQATLLQQRQAIEARWVKEVGQLDKLQATQQRVRRDTDKVQAKRVTGNTAQVRDQKKRSVALTTYVALPISLEEERQRLLELFRD